MKTKFFALLIIVSSAALAQTSSGETPALALSAPTTFPIVFTKSIGANDAHPGDAVVASTTQVVHLEDGVVVPKGAKITGHVLAADPLVHDNTPYAQQKPSLLSIQFDSIEIDHQSVPLRATVRAMADPVTSESARTAVYHQLDPAGATTQIGGGQRYPWNAPVTDENGDVVAYSRNGGVYAHLMASNGCDGSSVEVSVGIFSASACGLYGFYRTTVEEAGSVAHPSMLTLVSTHEPPKIWKSSTALLEVLPHQQTVAAK